MEFFKGGCAIGGRTNLGVPMMQLQGVHVGGGCYT